MAIMQPVPRNPLDQLRSGAVSTLCHSMSVGLLIRVATYKQDFLNLIVAPERTADPEADHPPA